MPRCLVLLALLLGALPLGACEPVVVKDRRGDVDGRTFEFSSGGAYHPDGRGEWILRLRGDALWMARDERGAISEYGPFALSASEAGRMWRLVDRAAIRARPASARDDGPDDIRYRFTVMPATRGRKAKQRPWTIELWSDEVAGDEDLTRLVKYEGKLVRKYAKKKPRF